MMAWWKRRHQSGCSIFLSVKCQYCYKKQRHSIFCLDGKCLYFKMFQEVKNFFEAAIIDILEDPRFYYLLYLLVIKIYDFEKTMGLGWTRFTNGSLFSLNNKMYEYVNNLYDLKRSFDHLCNLKNTEAKF